MNQLVKQSGGFIQMSKAQDKRHITMLKQWDTLKVERDTHMKLKAEVEQTYQQLEGTNEWSEIKELVSFNALSFAKRKHFCSHSTFENTCMPELTERCPKNVKPQIWELILEPVIKDAFETHLT